MPDPVKILSTNTRRMTPWGRADYQYNVAPGVAWVNTPGHGGFLIGRKAAEKYLTAYAIVRGEKFGNFLAFEEDCDATIVLFENPAFVELLGFKRASPSELAESLGHWHQDYLLLR